MHMMCETSKLFLQSLKQKSLSFIEIFLEPARNNRRAQVQWEKSVQVAAEKININNQLIST